MSLTLLEQHDLVDPVGLAEDEKMVIKAFQINDTCCYSLHVASDMQSLGGGIARVLTLAENVAVGKPVTVLIGDRPETFTVDKLKYDPEIHGAFEGQTRFYWEARFRLEPNTANANRECGQRTPEAKEM